MIAINTIPKALKTRRGCLMVRVTAATYLLLPMPSHSLIFRKTIFFFFPLSGFRINEHITGLNVRATTVEISTDTTIVTVNWRYNCPVIPLKKLTGTNTAANTSDVAIKALASPFIAFFVASYGLRCSVSMICSTPSTTTIASSTTIPMARINPSNVSIFSEKPKINMNPKVPINEIGTATTGINVARQLCKDR